MKGRGISDKPILETDEQPLLVIEVRDLNSLPIVKHNGKVITGIIAIEYSCGTNTEVAGQHEYTIEHVIEQDIEKKFVIRKLNEKRWV
ncbi:hypothetical protein [Paenibacillus sp. 7516]|uniref:hypothetical protein n=1 Tax=Paenibacillus sp. 7516 TaxID=2022549 RepID=UPI000BA63341|nr:hypothetical protein [Paenibacillus sp. 7516]PAF31869.1 hypothetical protein CHI14_09460 [Paenibacillus sp. 7516]